MSGQEGEDRPNGGPRETRDGEPGQEAAGPDETASDQELSQAPPASDTVGTGSYVALSCSVMALLVTFLILGILFLLRWL